MNTEQLVSIMNKLVVLLQTGDEAAAATYLNEVIPQLPKDLQLKLGAQLFFQSLQAEAEVHENVAELQQDGMLAIQALERAKAEMMQE